MLGLSSLLVKSVELVEELRLRIYPVGFVVETEMLAGVDSANFPAEDVALRFKTILLVSIDKVIESSAKARR